MKFSAGAPITVPVGRFAPSPTGPLHFGSLLAAVASYLEVGAGTWLVRVEDVDRPRTVAGMSTHQLETLAAYGFKWSTSGVVRQSERSALYQTALERLISTGLVYPCTCTRSMLANDADTQVGVDGARIYPGHCRHWQPGDPVPEKAAWRFRVGGVDDPPIVFHDRIQGDQAQQLAREVGDFVIKRADGCFTYQLAVVVDDLAQGVTQVVRGADLLDSTARQIALVEALNGRVPTYAHIPIVTNPAGEKLSKQTRATALPTVGEHARVAALWHALSFLGQSPPDALMRGGVETLWQWAAVHWSIERVPKQRSGGSFPEIPE